MTCQTGAHREVTSQLREKNWSIEMPFGDVVCIMHGFLLVSYGQSIFIDEHHTKQGVMYKK